MASQKDSLAKSTLTTLSVGQMQAGISRLKRRINEIKSFDVNNIFGQFYAPELNALEISIKDTIQQTFGVETAEANLYSGACDFYRGQYHPGKELDVYTVRKHVESSKHNSIALLTQAVRSLEERLSDAQQLSATKDAPIEKLKSSREIFIVHGHDVAVRESVASFLRKIDLEPIILHEKPNSGRTIIEKFEENSEVGFAIVLLTPDDLGRCLNGEEKLRARQNVILELGYFCGRLGRSKVCALKKGDLELPSDVIGVAYTDFDARGAWKQDLARELEAAGYEVDWQKAMK